MMHAYVDTEHRLHIIAERGDESEELLAWWNSVFTKSGTMRRSGVKNNFVNIVYYPED